MESQSSNYRIAYEPDLVPPPALMRLEGIDVLEEWYRWAEEWSVLLRVYGGLAMNSAVLEIGCGLGRTAFALRYYLPRGSYSGFEICPEKVRFLKERFEPAHPNFSFIHADVHNTEYNPAGRSAPGEYRFPFADASFDIVYAASVFTHMLPEGVERYVGETSRVLRPGGRAVFSFLLLDFYRPGQSRPLGFSRPDLDFPVRYKAYDADFGAADAKNLEHMTAYRLRLIERFARAAGLNLEQSIPGLWSGSVEQWIGAQDLVILRKPKGVP